MPSFSVLRLHGTQPERERLKNGIRNEEIEFDICLTTYEAFVAEDSWFKTRRWTYCVLDEGHRIKNSETNVSTKARGLGSLFKLRRSIRLVSRYVTHSYSSHRHPRSKQSHRAMGIAQLAVSSRLYSSHGAAFPSLFRSYTRLILRNLPQIYSGSP